MSACEAQVLLERLVREREHGRGGDLVVVEAHGVEEAMLSPLLRSSDGIARGSTPLRWMIALLDPPRAALRVGVCDIRLVAARVEAALLGALSREVRLQVGWLDGRAELPLALREAEEHALMNGRVERERRALFTAVGHELRTPLTSVRGYLEVLLSDPPRRRAEARRFLEIAQRETLRAARLVDGIFELSLLETGALPLRVSMESLAPIARAAIESLALEARKRGVSIRRTLQNAPANLDEARAAQAVLNVVHNAIKFARSGVWVATVRRGADAVLTVDDDGPGFSEEDLRMVPSFGRRGSAARGIAGSGVGLALAEAVAVLHGGRLALERSPRGGARVRLALPAGHGHRRAVLHCHGAEADVRPPQ